MVRVIGAVAEGAPAYRLSWQSGTVVETESADTIADGLAVRRPLQPNVDAIRDLVDDVVSVSEDDMRAAIRRLRADEGVVAEPAGAAAAAALLKRADVDEPAVVLVTGRNVNPTILESIDRIDDARTRLRPSRGVSDNSGAG